MTPEQLESTFEQNKDRYIQEWSDLVRFPSISADPRHKEDCVACGQWLVDNLTTMGFEARLIETSGIPVVFAERVGNPD